MVTGVFRMLRLNVYTIRLIVADSGVAPCRFTARRSVRLRRTWSDSSSSVETLCEGVVFVCRRRGAVTTAVVNGTNTSRTRAHSPPDVWLCQTVRLTFTGQGQRWPERWRRRSGRTPASSLRICPVLVNPSRC